MARQKSFYNPETETRALYTETFVTEAVTVKDCADLTVTHHYWADTNGDLWGDFEHPMENIALDFAAYRLAKRLMSPNEITALRNWLKLSISEFAQRLGIDSTTLAQIEANQRLQTTEQDQLFRQYL